MPPRPGQPDSHGSLQHYIRHRPHPFTVSDLATFATRLESVRLSNHNPALMAHSDMHLGNFSWAFCSALALLLLPLRYYDFLLSLINQYPKSPAQW